MMMEYYVVEATTAEDLSRQVNELLKKGWQLNGTMVVAVPNVIKLYQSMVFFASVPGEVRFFDKDN